VAGWLPAAIENLPNRYRDAVRLYELQGVSQAEIAERLGISLSGAKSRVQRGREKLKQVLERCCRFDLDRCGNVLSCVPRSSGCDYCD
jgi:RNA polymerase sigma-70 factor (ECF subfamily)